MPIPLPDNTDSGQRACTFGNQMCDPYARTGCADPALNCYVTGPSRTTCDCPSSPGAGIEEGAACATYNDCAVGLACLQFGAADSRCVKVCRPGGTDCAASACMPFGASIGFCQPAL